MSKGLGPRAKTTLRGLGLGLVLGILVMAGLGAAMGRSRAILGCLGRGVGLFVSAGLGLGALAR